MSKYHKDLVVVFHNSAEAAEAAASSQKDACAITQITSRLRLHLNIAEHGAGIHRVAHTHPEMNTYWRAPVGSTLQFAADFPQDSELRSRCAAVIPQGNNYAR